MTTLLKGATVLTMAGEEKPFVGDVLLDGDRIAAVGMELPERGARVVSAKGLYLTPGLIDAHSHVGLQENCVGWEGLNTDEIADPIAPQLSALDAVNPEDVGFAEALSGGVTAAAIGPGSGNVMGGQFTLVRTHGTVIDDMVIRPCVALKAAMGENPRKVYGDGRGRAPVTRMGTADLLRQALEKGRAELEPNVAPSRRQLALAGLLRGDYPLKVHLHRKDDICTAIRISHEFGITLSLEHATDAYRIPELIAREQRDHGLRLVLGQYLSGPKKVESVWRTAKAPALLAAHGVRFALMTDHPAIPMQYLSVQAGVLVREGLDEHAALRAITCDAAWAVGAQEEIGSIAVGKAADLALWDGFPLDMRSRARQVYSRGTLVYEG